MKPLVVLLNSLTGGGSERKTIALCNALARRGRTVHLCYLDRKETLLSTVEESRNLHVECLDRRSRLDSRALKAFRQRVERYEACRVLAINPYQVFFAARSLVAGAHSHSLIAATNTFSFRTTKERLLFHGFQKREYRRSDLVLFGCKAQQELWCASYGLDSSKSRVVYNGVDLEHFSPTAVEPVAPRSAGSEGLTIVQVSSLTQHKRHLDLMRAARVALDRGVELRLVFAGTGPMEASLRREARKLRLEDRLSFTGFLSDVRPCLRASDVSVLPSNAVETFSNAVLESMAMGKPVIVSRIGGAAEQVEDGVNGLLFEPGDVAALAVALERMKDESFRGRAGDRSRSIAVERFGLDRMVDAYESLLD